MDTQKLIVDKIQEVLGSTDKSQSAELKKLIDQAGHIFVAGLINDVVMGFPLGISSLSYLVVCFVSNYVRNKSVNTTIASDWFTFFIALIFANLLFFSLLNNFSDIAISYSKISYNTFFTLFLFPIFWLLFSLYQSNFIGGQDA